MKQTIVILALMLAACFADNIMHPVKEHQHECKYPDCPYKGLKESRWDSALLVEHAGNAGSDAYCIDWLHLTYPTCNYDALDAMLFDPDIDGPRGYAEWLVKQGTPKEQADSIAAADWGMTP